MSRAIDSSGTFDKTMTGAGGMPTRWRFYARPVLVLLFVLWAPPAAAQTTDAVRVQVEAGAYAAEVKLFYRQRAYAPAWISELRLGAQVDELVAFIASAERHGLDPDGYHLSRIQAFCKAARDGALQPADAAILDLLLTDAALRYGRHLLQGRVDPRSIHAGWSLPPRQADLGALLQKHLAVGSLQAWFDRLPPSDPAYVRLQEALARYRTLAERGGWPAVPEGAALERGDRDERVVLLRAQVRLVGDLADDAPDSADVFDGALEEAVRAFQRRHGLEADGIVGRETRAALNVPVEMRIRQIALNLERLRWLPVDLGRRYVRINIAGYQLRVIEDGAPGMAMRVIVGTPRNRTPVFSSRITEVVLAPYWYVPTSIAVNEIWPQVRRDSTYLARHHMKVLAGGRIRQDPGPANPLGQIKFVIPNPYGVGLHDTPERRLFASPTCAFSHGCLRVERPLDLALYVLRGDTTWTRAAIETTIQQWKETPIPAPAPLIPVYVLYETAWVDEGGTVFLYPDIYGYDARLERLLFSSPAEAVY